MFIFVLVPRPPPPTLLELKLVDYFLDLSAVADASAALTEPDPPPDELP